MKTWMLRALSVGAFGVLAGCSASAGSSPSDPQNPVVSPDTSGAIDSLVSQAGKIDSNLEPGLVKTSATTKVAVADPSGATPGWSCSETGYSLTNEPSKFVVVDPNADVLWPGSLVQGNSLASGL